MIQDAFDDWFTRRMLQIEGDLIQDAELTTADMKARAPWTDDTGRARASLTARVDVEVSGAGATGRIEYTLEYADSEVTYAADLEYDHNGKYAVIRPMMQELRRRIPEMVAQRLGG